MRTALLLLLLLAIAAVPGSLVPQRSSDPNGVTQYFRDNPELAPILDKIQMFDVFSSAWFSAIYLLLFVSLIGCIIPRTKHHYQAMRQRPPRTPIRLSRLEAFQTQSVTGGDAAVALEQAESLLKKSGYRTERYTLTGRRGQSDALSVSAERGYLRETGNLVFHSALVGVLVAVGIGGGTGFAGQRVVVEGQSMVNTLLDFNSFNPGRFFDPETITPFKLSLDTFEVDYETENLNAYGQPTDFRANVTTTLPGADPLQEQVKVNHPLDVGGNNVYLLGNGYAPMITVRNAEGGVVFRDAVPFLPQDDMLTSLGIVKVPDGLEEQLGLIGFFYPTAMPLESGAYASSFPDLVYPMVSFNVYEGDLGINDGTPRSVYELETDGLTQIAGGESEAGAIKLMPGQYAELPGGRGTVTFENALDPEQSVLAQDAVVAHNTDFGGTVPRFASFDIHSDPGQIWVLIFALLALGGLLVSLFIPRRRVWVKISETDSGLNIEYAGLARGEDPTLNEAVRALSYRHGTLLGVERDPRES